MEQNIYKINSAKGRIERNNKKYSKIKVYQQSQKMSISKFCEKKSYVETIRCPLKWKDRMDFIKGCKKYILGK